MQRIQAVDPAEATGKAKQLLDGVQAKLGLTPNMMRTMAASPAVLDAYLKFSAALAAGSLGAKLGESIALTVAQENSCAYCLAAHATLGKMAGLTDHEILASRRADSDDARTTSALEFARKVVDGSGSVSDSDMDRVRAAGFTDGAIAEIIANVALNVFTNYFNIAAQVEVDFPAIELSLPATA